MCLFVAPNIHDRMSKILEKKGQMTFYKVYYRDDDGWIRSLYRQSCPNLVKGCIKSTRKSTKRNLDEWSQVNSGIHVFVYKKHAMFRKVHYTDRFIVPVVGKAEDFVAGGCIPAGTPTAVFTKVYVDIREFKKAIKLAKTDTPSRIYVNKKVKKL